MNSPNKTPRRPWRPAPRGAAVASGVPREPARRHACPGQLRPGGEADGEAGSVFEANIPIGWNRGNHDVNKVGHHEDLWGDYLRGACTHARAASRSAAGIRASGRPSVGDAEPMFASRKASTRSLRPVDRRRSGLPLAMRATLFLRMLRPSPSRAPTSSSPMTRQAPGAGQRSHACRVHPLDLDRKASALQVQSNKPHPGITRFANQRERGGTEACMGGASDNSTLRN